MVANLHLTLLDYTWQKSMLQQEITELMSQERLYTAKTADVNSLYSARRADIKQYYRELYETNPEFREMYKNFEDIPGYERELDDLDAQLEQELAELKEKENEINAAITQKSTDIKEMDAYAETFKQWLSANIQDSFNLTKIGG